MKRSIVALLSVLLSSVLTTCNTTGGVGEDVEAGGG